MKKIFVIPLFVLIATQGCIPGRQSRTEYYRAQMMREKAKHVREQKKEKDRVLQIKHEKELEYYQTRRRQQMATEANNKLNRKRTSFDDIDLYYLSPSVQYRYLNLSRTAVKGDGLKHISHWKHLLNLNLSFTSLNSNAYKYLESLTGISTLNISSSSIDDEGMKYVGKLPKLRYLYMGKVNVTDKGLSHLRNLTMLSSLVLDHTKISGTAFNDLTKLPLKELNLQLVSITPDGMRAIGNLPKLRVLKLGKVTPKTMDSLAKSKIQILDMTKSQLSPQGYAVLSKLTNLKLILLPSNVSPAILGYVAKSKVKDLDLSNICISDKGLKALSPMNVEILKMCGNNLTFKGLSHMNKMKKLKSLTIQGGRRLKNSALFQVGKIENLNFLTIIQAKFGPVGIEYLARAKKLRVIKIPKGKTGIRALNALSSLNSLQNLEISILKGNDKYVRAFKKMKMLKYLSLHIPIPKGGSPLGIGKRKLLQAKIKSRMYRRRKRVQYPYPKWVVKLIQELPRTHVRIHFHRNTWF
jgi:Leucine Rich repeat